MGFASLYQSYAALRGRADTFICLLLNIYFRVLQSFAKTLPC